MSICNKLTGFFSKGYSSFRDLYSNVYERCEDFLNKKASYTLIAIPLLRASQRFISEPSSEYVGSSIVAIGLCVASMFVMLNRWQEEQNFARLQNRVQSVLKTQNPADASQALLVCMGESDRNDALSRAHIHCISRHLKHFYVIPIWASGA